MTITDAAIRDETTVVLSRMLTDGVGVCPVCQRPSDCRDSTTRTLTDLPVAGRPIRLVVQVPRYSCTSADCVREIFVHNTDRLAAAGHATTRRCARHLLRRLMCDRATVSVVDREPGLSWDSVKRIAVQAARQIIATDESRLDEVPVIGVDEHRWSHTGRDSDDYVTAVVDLSPVSEDTGRSRLLDLTQAFRGQVKTGATWMASVATRPPQPNNSPSGRPLRTRLPLLTSRQPARLISVFGDDTHLAVAATWHVCHARRRRLRRPQPPPRRDRDDREMTVISDSLRRGAPDALTELAQLGRTLWRHRHDVLAYCDDHTAHGPTEAINGRLEALHHNTLGFRNQIHYRIRSQLHCGHLTRRIDAL